MKLSKTILSNLDPKKKTFGVKFLLFQDNNFKCSLQKRKTGRRYKPSQCMFEGD